VGHLCAGSSLFAFFRWIFFHFGLLRCGDCCFRDSSGIRTSCSHFAASVQQSGASAEFLVLSGPRSRCDLNLSRPSQSGMQQRSRVGRRHPILIDEEGRCCLRFNAGSSSPQFRFVLSRTADCNVRTGRTSRGCGKCTRNGVGRSWDVDELRHLAGSPSGIEKIRTRCSWRGNLLRSPGHAAMRESGGRVSSL